MSEFLQFLVAGLKNGSIYALIALGFTIVYAATGAINFAQGEFFMLGGMLCVSFTDLGMPLPVAAVAPLTQTAFFVGAAIGVKGFAAAILGGIGNPITAVAGGLLLGLLESFAAGYLDPAYKDGVALVVLLVVLFVAPQGLLAKAGRVKV